MPNTLQTFLAAATQKAADDLVATVESLPEDRRGWSPSDKGRTALDQVAECAILNGGTADIIASRTFPPGFDYQSFQRAKTELAQDWNNLKALLQANTTRVIAAIQSVPDDALEIQIDMPWGKMSLAEILAYPYWNMSYHQGQTYYIGSIA